MFTAHICSARYIRHHHLQQGLRALFHLSLRLRWIQWRGSQSCALGRSARGSAAHLAIDPSRSSSCTHQQESMPAHLVPPPAHLLPLPAHLVLHLVRGRCFCARWSVCYLSSCFRQWLRPRVPSPPSPPPPPGRTALSQSSRLASSPLPSLTAVSMLQSVTSPGSDQAPVGAPPRSVEKT
jgi:hypothetical protein